MQILENRDKFELNHNMTISVVESDDESLQCDTSEAENCHSRRFDNTPLCYNIVVYMYTAFEDLCVSDRLHVGIACDYMPPKLAVNESIMEEKKCVDVRFRKVTMTANFLGSSELALQNFIHILRKYTTIDTFMGARASVTLGEDLESPICIYWKGSDSSLEPFAFNKMNYTSGRKLADCTFWNQTGLI